MTGATTADAVWGKASSRLEAELGGRFAPCFAGVVAQGLSGGVLTLAAPNAFVRDRILERFLTVVESAVREAAGWPIRVELEVLAETRDDGPPSPRRSSPDLNPRYSFETFVIGAGNQLAHGAALKVAEAPGWAFNPLLLHGETGLGKTHLLQAVARYLSQRAPASSVRYATSEGFLNSFVAAVAGRRMARFRERHRGVDVLVLDDVQFFAGKERVQEELLHTFTALYERGCQIVLSSDRPPGELGTIDAGLRSRFEMGLVARIDRPDLETRVAILRKLAEAQQLEVLDPDLLRYVAERVTRNVRELQGALTRLAAFSSLLDRPLTLELASELLPGADSGEISIERVEEVVSETFGLPVAELHGRRRTTELAFSRHLAMHLARELTGASLHSIGRHFGRDHTTVLYADRRVRRHLQEDRQARDLVEELTERVKSLR